jgi:DNA mismatch endonuclease (patch repair protein)
MADTLSKQQRSVRMALIRSKGTEPEMIVRRLVHRLGFRYRLHSASVPGKPDLVFSSRRKVIFVHGCFWHRHPDKGCKLARMPKSRLDFWEPKLDKNRIRDEQVRIRLAEQKWESLTIWECELNDLASLADRVRSFLNHEIH